MEQQQTTRKICPWCGEEVDAEWDETFEIWSIQEHQEICERAPWRVNLLGNYERKSQ